jgi:hypothetical protein
MFLDNLQRKIKGMLETFRDDVGVDTFVQERLSGFEKSACKNDDGSGSISGFDILGFGNFDQLD